MKALIRKQFSGKFCEYNERNFSVLSTEFKLGENKRTLRKTLNIYITSELEICFTYLTKDELTKLNVQEIELIDGLWYLKTDL